MARSIESHEMKYFIILSFGVFVAGVGAELWSTRWSRQVATRTTFLVVLLLLAAVSIPESIPKILPSEFQRLDVLLIPVLVLLLVRSRPFRRIGTGWPLIGFCLAMSISAVLGAARGWPLKPFGSDLVNVILIACGYAVGCMLGSSKSWSRATKVIVSITTLSAFAKVIAATTGVQLFRARIQSLPEAGQGTAQRVITGTEDIALLCFCLCAALILVHRSRDLRPMVLWLGVATSTIVMFLSAARNLLTVSAIALLLVAALAVRSGGHALNRVAMATALSPIVVVLVLTLGSDLFATAQWNGYAARVLGNFDVVPTAGTSWDYRLAEVIGAKETFQRSPVLGTGLGGRYRNPFSNEDYNSFGPLGGMYYIHNAYWWVLAKTGLMGMLGLALLSLRGIGFGFRVLIRPAAFRINAIPVGLLAFIVAMAIRSIVTPAIVDGAGAISFGLTIGGMTAMALGRDIQMNEPEDETLISTVP